MRCSECLLERQGSDELDPETFLDNLSECTECPLVTGQGADPRIRLLVTKNQQTARLLRRQGSTIRQQRNELQALADEMGKYENRIAKLELLHQSSMRELQAQMQLAQAQQAAVRAMSAPIIRVWKDVLALPVIGKLDRERTELIMANLLSAIQSQRSRHAIIDLTGVHDIDTATADHLLQIARAAQLLGSQVILTGMQSGVAQALVQINVELSAITTMGNIENALRRCMTADSTEVRNPRSRPKRQRNNP